jgi:hypothetical protein
MSTKADPPLPTLTALSTDVLREIFEYIPAFDIIIMWITGDKWLQHFMASGGVTNFVESSARHLGLHLPFPDIVSCFLKLKKFHFYQENRSGSLCLWKEGLNKLPKTVEDLQLRLESAYTILKYYADDSRIVHFSQMFPDLRRLHVESETRSMTEGSQQVELELPISLSYLHYDVHPVNLKTDFAQFSPNLTHLNLKVSFKQQNDQITLPPGLETLKLFTSFRPVFIRAIPSLTSLRELEISFDDYSNIMDPNDSEIWPLLSKLPRSLILLSLSNVHLANDFIASLPRSLQKLYVLRLGDGWMAEDLMGCLPKNLTSLGVASLSHDNHSLAFRNAEKPYKSDLIASYLRSLPRTLRELWSPFPRTFIDSDEEMEALPPNITSLALSINLHRISADLVPQSLHTINMPGRVYFNDETLAKLPKSIQLLHLPRSQLTPASIPTLLSFKNLRTIRAIPIDCFATDIEESYAFMEPLPSDNAPDGVLMAIQRSLVRVETFLPPSVTLLRLEKTQDKIYVLDFPKLDSSSQQLKPLACLFSTLENHREYEMTKIRCFEWEKTNRLPSLERLSFNHDPLDRESLNALVHITPNLRELFMYRLNYSLTDEDLDKLPPTLTTLHFNGDVPTKITPASLFKLPKKLQKIHLPSSPHADWIEAGYKIGDVKQRLPRTLTVISFTDDPKCTNMWVQAMNYDHVTK